METLSQIQSQKESSIIHNEKHLESIDLTLILNEFALEELNNDVFLSKQSSYEFLEEESTEISAILSTLNSNSYDLAQDKSFNSNFENEKKDTEANEELLSILKRQPSTARNVFKRTCNFKSFSTQNVVSKPISMVGRVLFKN